MFIQSSESSSGIGLMKQTAGSEDESKKEVSVKDRHQDGSVTERLRVGV